MPKRKHVKSFREVARFIAIDQGGVQHTVVERVETRTRITFAITYGNASLGASTYYSMTTGDKLSRQPDGTFEGYQGSLKLKVM